jgi:hypothetical protein
LSTSNTMAGLTLRRIGATTADGALGPGATRANRKTGQGAVAAAWHPSLLPFFLASLPPSVQLSVFLGSEPCSHQASVVFAPHPSQCSAQALSDCWAAWRQAADRWMSHIILWTEVGAERGTPCAERGTPCAERGTPCAERGTPCAERRKGHHVILHQRYTNDGSSAYCIMP